MIRGLLLVLLTAVATTVAIGLVFLQSRGCDLRVALQLSDPHGVSIAPVVTAAPTSELAFLPQPVVGRPASSKGGDQWPFVLGPPPDVHRGSNFAAAQPRSAAWVMFASGSGYLYSALVMAFALRRRIEERRDLVLMLPRNERLPPGYAQAFAKLRVSLLRVPPPPLPAGSSTLSGYKLAFSKAWAFNLTKYERVVFIDTDAYIPGSPGWTRLEPVFSMRLLPNQIVAQPDGIDCHLANEPIIQPSKLKVGVWGVHLSSHPEIDKKSFPWSYGMSSGLLAYDPSQERMRSFLSYVRYNASAKDNDQLVLYKLCRTGVWPRPILMDFPFKMMERYCMCTDLRKKESYNVANLAVGIFTFQNKPWETSWQALRAFCDTPARQWNANKLNTTDGCKAFFWCQWVADHKALLRSNITGPNFALPKEAHWLSTM